MKRANILMTEGQALANASAPPRQAIGIPNNAGPDPQLPDQIAYYHKRIT
jgi:hypothetical protein